ncbi:hypothetical protein SDC9_61440 [bioreactor metagenome]|uniref:Uncharacterized protein n=1 Tax=bioreactor metagenome TaxID=1076179 RepID=A0A644XLV6_9ZZZZ
MGNASQLSTFLFGLECVKQHRFYGVQVSIQLPFHRKNLDNRRGTYLFTPAAGQPVHNFLKFQNMVICCRQLYIQEDQEMEKQYTYTKILTPRVRTNHFTKGMIISMKK